MNEIMNIIYENFLSLISITLNFLLFIYILRLKKQRKDNVFKLMNLEQILAPRTNRFYALSIVLQYCNYKIINSEITSREAARFAFGFAEKPAYQDFRGSSVFPKNLYKEYCKTSHDDPRRLVFSTAVVLNEIDEINIKAETIDEYIDKTDIFSFQKRIEFFYTETCC